MPLALRLVIERCLVKDPASRYQRASDVREALKRVGTNRSWPVVWRLLLNRKRGALRITAVATCLMLAALSDARVRQHLAVTAPRVGTLAVLPLGSEADKEGEDVFGAGMTEALTAQLGATGAIRVMSRASVVHAARSGSTAPEIGRTLGADAVLHGAVERTADRIRLRLRLTDVTTGRMLWSDDFERSRREVFEGDAGALEQLLPEVYRELRRIASRQLRRERADHTLVPTALVHEVYLRLVDQQRVTWQNRAHFFGLTANRCAASSWITPAHATRRSVAMLLSGPLPRSRESARAGPARGRAGRRYCAPATRDNRSRTGPRRRTPFLRGADRRGNRLRCESLAADNQT